jgi:hypothetical protein
MAEVLVAEVEPGETDGAAKGAKRRLAGKKSAATKGAAELKRAADMAAWTKLHGKNDILNPFARENYDSAVPALAHDAPLPALDDPAAAEDARKVVLAAIVAREGQGAFRGALLAAYGRRCAVTGCAEVEALEAAHIRPYLGPLTNGASNGLLLRADVHTLFDKALLSFEAAASWPPMVAVAPKVSDPAYRALHGATLRLPEQVHRWPNRAALVVHRKSCGW